MGSEPRRSMTHCSGMRRGPDSMAHLRSFFGRHDARQSPGLDLSVDVSPGKTRLRRVRAASRGY